MICHPATVDIDVLPPIDTSQWSATSIDTHVTDVRNQYLKVLGQKQTAESTERAEWTS
jgi:putative phosphoserine phosphatase/1-acylglycerol-3-phosphate O-acyltransferase